LYEATQGPPLPVDAPPALNPTGGVKGKQPPPLNGLQYKKDSSREGSGVFIAHGATRAEDYKDVPEGVIVSEVPEGEKANESCIYPGANGCASLSCASSRCRTLFVMMLAGLLSVSPTSMVNITPLGGNRGNFPNVNPVMDNVMATAPGNVQLMNVLDVPQAQNTLEQFAMTDTGLLDGIPGGMFDWGEWHFIDIGHVSYSCLLQVNGIHSFHASMHLLQILALMNKGGRADMIMLMDCYFQL
jgi:hypothetical protein